MIDCIVDGHTALVTLKRPPANAFNIESLAALEALICRLNANADMRAVVITGEGKFSALAPTSRRSRIAIPIIPD